MLIMLSNIKCLLTCEIFVTIFLNGKKLISNNDINPDSYRNTKSEKSIINRTTG
jgi:hypothetical protein